jgi:hypothetical protein
MARLKTAIFKTSSAKTIPRVGTRPSTIFAEDAVFYDPKTGVTVAAMRSRVAAIRAITDFRYQPMSRPRWAMAGGSDG